MFKKQLSFDYRSGCETRNQKYQVNARLDIFLLVGTYNLEKIISMVFQCQLKTFYCTNVSCFSTIKAYLESRFREMHAIETCIHIESFRACAGALMPLQSLKMI